jgi:hypothetical protein
MSVNKLHPAYRVLLYVVLLALFLSGVLWEADVARPLLIEIHGAAAMATLVLLGTLLARHVPAGWGAGGNRTSGLALLAAALWLVVTGYALYYAGGDLLRDFAAQTHFWVGLGVAVAFVVHRMPARDRYNARDAGARADFTR